MAADVRHVAEIVWRRVDEGVPLVVIEADGSETLVARRSRFEQGLDRLRRCSRVRVETRRDGGTVRTRVTDRATLERELLSA
ncbi:MAG: hypothetical protein WBC33_11030 [Conexibacter sp.]